MAIALRETHTVSKDCTYEWIENGYVLGNWETEGVLDLPFVWAAYIVRVEAYTGSVNTCQGKDWMEEYQSGQRVLTIRMCRQKWRRHN